jgi:hypothetical protein
MALTVLRPPKPRPKRGVLDASWTPVATKLMGSSGNSGTVCTRRHAPLGAARLPRPMPLIVRAIPRRSRSQGRTKAAQISDGREWRLTRIGEFVDRIPERQKGSFNRRSKIAREIRPRHRAASQVPRVTSLVAYNPIASRSLLTTVSSPSLDFAATRPERMGE